MNKEKLLIMKKYDVLFMIMGRNKSHQIKEVKNNSVVTTENKEFYFNNIILDSPSLMNKTKNNKLSDEELVELRSLW